jgi:SAM-dependent methyltransferase
VTIAKDDAGHGQAGLISTYCGPSITRGTLPEAGSPEYVEMMKYESGDADKDAEGVPGVHADPWLNVLDACEPGSPPALREALGDPEFGSRIAGRVIDLGAGTCWATAEVSRLNRVTEIVALDLSARFLTTVGARIIVHHQGRMEKVRFAVSKFDQIPFPNEYFDCVMLIAALHHAIAPLLVLLESRRVLRLGGILLVIEQPAAVLGISRRRKSGLTLTAASGATEIAYTRGELDYLLACAGFGQRKFKAVGMFSKNPLKSFARRTLRGLGLEDLVLSVGYNIWAERDAG